MGNWKSGPQNNRPPKLVKAKSKITIGQIQTKLMMAPLISQNIVLKFKPNPARPLANLFLIAIKKIAANERPDID